MWGVVPAAGSGSRIQPLAFSKELLPVGSRRDGDVERPRAVTEYLLDRMVLAGAKRIAIVLAPQKADLLAYFGASYRNASLTYLVQPSPLGLCDAIFRALPLVAPDEHVLVGLPDTIWFPEDGLRRLPEDDLSFLLFPVERPEFFDAVVEDGSGGVVEIEVKQPEPRSRWIWGAFKVRGAALARLHALWREPGRGDAYVGTLVNAYLARGGSARAVRAGEAYVDVGTLDGYRQAIRLLAGTPAEPESAEPRAATLSGGPR